MHCGSYAPQIPIQKGCSRGTGERVASTEAEYNNLLEDARKADAVYFGK
jgi:hypothetical protein